MSERRIGRQAFLVLVASLGVSAWIPEGSGRTKEDNSVQVSKATSAVSIEYNGQCRSEEARKLGPTCSRWVIDGHVAEIGGRGQIVGSENGPSVWTFGTLEEGSCQPGRLQETCGTQGDNEIVWLDE